MLYDFHKYQNETKANSVHATYLVYGSKTIQSASNGDVEMSSSMPDQDVGSETVPTKSLTLVAEENLQGSLNNCAVSHVMKAVLTATRFARSVYPSCCHSCLQLSPAPSTRTYFAFGRFKIPRRVQKRGCSRCVEEVWHYLEQPLAPTST